MSTDYQCACAGLGAVKGLADTDAPLDALLLMEEDAIDKLEQMAGFIRAAGDVPAEAVFRWSAAKGLHPLPAEMWAEVDVGVRVVFDVFTRVCKAVRPIWERPPGPREIPVGKEAPRQLEDTVFERGEGLDDREAFGKTAPFEVIPMRRQAAPEAPAAAAGRVVATGEELSAISKPAEGGGVTVDLDDLDAIRAKARLENPNSVDAINNERPGPGPEAEAAEARHVVGVVGGETIEGTVVVTRAKSARGKGA